MAMAFFCTISICLPCSLVRPEWKTGAANSNVDQNTCLVDLQELVSGATKGLKPDKDPKFTSSSLADVINMWLPAQVACQGYTQKFCLVDYFKGKGVGSQGN